MANDFLAIADLLADALDLSGAELSETTADVGLRDGIGSAWERSPEDKDADLAPVTVEPGKIPDLESVHTFPIRNNTFITPEYTYLVSAISYPVRAENLNTTQEQQS